MGAVNSKVNMVRLSAEETGRFRRFVAKNGTKKAKQRIGVSDLTFENALDFGLMRPATRETVLQRLKREEDIDAESVSGSAVQEEVHPSDQSTGGLLRGEGAEEAGRGEDL